MVIGAQLYTVTKFCQNLDDLSETLKKVADMGYTSVQLSGVCEYDPKWMKEQLDLIHKTGFECFFTGSQHDATIGVLKEYVKNAILDGVIENSFEAADALMREKAAELGLFPVK